MPGNVALSYGETTTTRLPLAIALTEQSDREPVFAALRDELSGGDRTGFDPEEADDGSFVVAFTSCTVEATVA
jgi:hypothetical protein